jgi:predicted Fe-Mo cluster-binding NifX family protein
MKIAFTTTGDSLEAPFNSTFGRAQKFLIYDTDSGSVEVIDNRQNLQAAQGAGIQAAQTVGKTGAQVLVSGHCGPKAFRVLAAQGIKVYYAKESTVDGALKSYLDGKLVQSNSADVESHHA